MATSPSNNFDFQNYYSATLQADITAGSLTLSLDNVPTPTEGILVIEPDSANNREIIFYTGKTVSTITLPSDGRGWDSTTATAHLAGSTVIMAPVAYMLRMLKSGSLYDSTKTGWTTLGTAPTYVQHNGQKEYLLSTITDLTGVVGPGTKLKYDRPAGTPTQSMQFVSASSQYASKASPVGLTFTNNFTWEGWVYLDSYITTGDQTLASRYDGANGWIVAVKASTGQVSLNGFNGSVANSRAVQSYRSIPLNAWTHVALTLDMSGFTTATCKIFINGEDIPATLISTGTNPTSFAIGTGNLQLAAFNGANGFLNGKIAHARLWSTIRTTAQIRDNMANVLTGSETGLVALFPGNGDFTDKTANGNNLVGSGGAIATYADNPYKSTEYLIVTAVTSNQITAFAGSGSIPSTGTLSNFFYSSARSPFGFPSESSKWAISFIGKITQSVTPGGYVQVAGHQLMTPTGKWKLKLSAILTINGPLQPMGATVTVSDSVSAVNRIIMEENFAFIDKVSTFYNTYTRESNISLNSATPLYLIAARYDGNTTGMSVVGGAAAATITAECAYL